ncbi:MAG: hypothetical protein LBQ22_04680 [Bacteroidales bacterium]|jgi:hypothetical protein|nr:hypothetical protein [Bacteroidales bacterium]
MAVNNEYEYTEKPIKEFESTDSQRGGLPQAGHCFVETAVRRITVRALLEVQWKPRLRQAAGTLVAILA